MYEHQPPPLVATVSRSDCRDRLYFDFNLSVNAMAATLFALFSFSNRASDAILFFFFFGYKHLMRDLLLLSLRNGIDLSTLGESQYFA